MYISAQRLLPTHVKWLPDMMSRPCHKNICFFIQNQSDMFDKICGPLLTYFSRCQLSDAPAALFLTFFSPCFKMSSFQFVCRGGSGGGVLEGAPGAQMRFWAVFLLSYSKITNT